MDESWAHLTFFNLADLEERNMFSRLGTRFIFVHFGCPPILRHTQVVPQVVNMGAMNALRSSVISPESPISEIFEILRHQAIEISLLARDAIQGSI